MASSTAYTLPELPYGYDALEPVICKEIMTLHHSKHHAGYVKNLNAAQEKLAAALKESKYSSWFINSRERTNS